MILKVMLLVGFFCVFIGIGIESSSQRDLWQGEFQAVSTFPPQASLPIGSILPLLTGQMA